uniref:fructose-bisphosphate aldolase n=1 Tax=Chlamydomonas sp. (strain W80) TaxID=103365 RepID=V5YPR8_CHLSW|nr:fructose-bisphosphate aldolase, class II [Chlamydomonas sp. W80]
MIGSKSMLSRKGVVAGTSRKSLVCKAVSAPPSTKLSGVVYGKDLTDLMEHAQVKGYAIPAVNCTSSNIINATMESAKEANAPVMVQFSNGGGAALAGKAISNKDQVAAIQGCIAGALHVRQIAKYYGVPVVLHTDHCAKNLLPWMDGMMAANKEFFEKNGEPLFSSHMLDLSEEPIPENLEICQKYLKEMKSMGILLEMELGITGGEEDGVDNSHVAKEDLYSKPEEILQVYEALEPIAPKGYSIAAAFGNVHGVYSPGNVQLTPSILGNAQKYIKEQKSLSVDKPVYFVFHGGSGSSREEIREAISYGVVKMNIDTDTQWAYWDGVRSYEAKYHDYLQGQIGNPDGPEKPNKKIYDPRQWSRSGEQALVARMQTAFEDLNAMNVL